MSMGNEQFTYCKCSSNVYVCTFYFGQQVREVSYDTEVACEPLLVGGGKSNPL